MDITIKDMEESNLVDRVAEIILGRMEDRVKTFVLDRVNVVVAEVLDAQIRESVQGIIETHINKPIHLTNKWGEKTGETTTLSGSICDAFDKKMKKAHKDRFSRHNNQSGIQIVVEEFAIAGLEKEAMLMCKKLNSEAKEMTREAIKNIVAGQLGKL